MDVIIETFFAYPTGILSVLAIIAVAYWAFVLLGALDIEIFDTDADTGSEGGVWAALGLVGVPASVGLSVAILIAWLVVAVATQTITGPNPGILAGLAILLGGLVIGVLGARYVVKPLRPMFTVHGAIRSASLVGELCTVTTSRVDESFGQALVGTGADELLIQVRAPLGNPLERGSRALIVGRDDEDGSFTVQPSG